MAATARPALSELHLVRSVGLNNTYITAQKGGTRGTRSTGLPAVCTFFFRADRAWPTTDQEPTREHRPALHTRHATAVDLLAGKHLQGPNHDNQRHCTAQHIL